MWRTYHPKTQNTICAILPICPNHSTIDFDLIEVPSLPQMAFKIVLNSTKDPSSDLLQSDWKLMNVSNTSAQMHPLQYMQQYITSRSDKIVVFLLWLKINILHICSNQIEKLTYESFRYICTTAFFTIYTCNNELHQGVPKL